MDDYLLLVAGLAGGVDPEAVATVEAVLAAAGPTEVVEASELDQLTLALGRLEGRTPVVAGGDGTLHVTVNALRDLGLLASTPLGLIPLGTGNDLARTLELPADPAAAARRVVEGRARPLDLLADDGVVVVNAAHAGLGVAAAERAADLKGTLGRAAYPAGAVAAGAGADPLDLAVEVDGVALAGGEPLLLVGVGNGRTVGGGTELFPEADPGDGLAEVLAIADRGALERLRLGLAALSGAHADLTGVHTARGRQVLVTGAAVWNDDGELGDSARDGRTLTVEPGGWRLVC